MTNSLAPLPTTPSSQNSQDGLTTPATKLHSLSVTRAVCTSGSVRPSGLVSQSVVLPWPPKTLSPNARVHHMALAKTKKAYKEACMWQAKADGVKSMAAAKLHLTITFVPPDKRRRDLDNMLSSIKSGLDGLRDVLGVDDGHPGLDWQYSQRSAGPKVYSVEVEVIA